MRGKAFLIIFLLVATVGIYSIVYANGSVEQSQVQERYDVVVIGGEPEGVAAAVAAARNGAKTLLVEDREALGGLMTLGMLNYLDTYSGVDGKPGVAGLFAEWHEQVGGKQAFSIDESKEAFLSLVENEENLSLALQTNFIDVIKTNDGKTVVGAKLRTQEGTEVNVYADRFIDATQDADFAAFAGAHYFVGGEDILEDERVMGVTLMIHLRGVDWGRVKETARAETFGVAQVTEDVAWGFSDLHDRYEPTEENTRLRGLNLVKVGDEEDADYYINALQIFGVNVFDQQAIEKAIEKGKRETEAIVSYLQEEFPGFEQADIASFPNELYVRESRHILAEYQLPMADVWTNRDHWDGIAYGGYPVDVQATSVHDFGYILANPRQYAIPFRSLVPLDIEGVIVVGRSAGYSSVAAGSARVIPTGMAVGEAGGVATALSIEQGVSYRQLAYDKGLVTKLQTRLKKQGAKLGQFEVDYPYQGEWYDEAVQSLINLGLLVGGYDNDLGVDEELTVKHFKQTLLLNGLKRTNLDAYDQYKQSIEAVFGDTLANDATLSRDQLAEDLLEIFVPHTRVNDQPWQQAYEEGLIDEELYKRVQEDRVLLRKEGIYLVTTIINDRREGA
ncbi:FAD-dependent oxidoreductase [Desertibacillus haloalkaliphilus]|uniref:FAD-dependent oxidoreductase n=1 Tax=Desertibacillus haloalkaliphilus TaxID=1328930 RepID=UPI001C26079B|nr:FAD-dependent oxidoreductase [Desertibacillus haloalkaliphilus]MBU8905975.1 FAD-dependent oxidoreductase [Desertibacillus haloalkaliphilus]